MQTPGVPVRCVELINRILDSVGIYHLDCTPDERAVEALKSALKHKKMNVVNFLKAFPRKKRIDIVDILRGALPMPLDYKELSAIGKVAGLDNNKIYSIWENRLKQVLEYNGMNIYSNSELVNSMLKCAKEHIS